MTVRKNATTAAGNNTSGTTSGASTRETLSPTPPVECLSMRGVLHPSNESRWPEAIMASVSAASSARSSPRKMTAMSSADI